MQLVHAQRAREVLDRPGAVGGQVELGDLPAQAVVDEAGRQVQEEVAPQRRLQALHAHAVLQQAVQDGFADGVGILGLGLDAFEVSAEGAAAAAGGAVLGGGDLEDEDAPVGEGADGAGARLLAHAGGAAVRARGVLGGVPAVLVADRSG